MTKKSIFLSLVSFALIALGLWACSSVPLTGRNRLMLVSDDAILTSSFQQYKQFMSTAPVSKDRVQTQRVIRIGERIARATDTYLRSIGLASDAQKYRWEFNLVASPQVNAFCMPGGKIVVYEGLLKYATSDDELATVMSHEVAHAMAKHSHERMSQQLMRQYGANALSVVMSGKSDMLRKVAGSVYGIGSEVLVVLPYSRKHEYEADIIGLYLMSIAGYNPEAAISFWTNMSSGKGGGQPAEIMSTHPSDANRIKAIREELPKVRQFMAQGGTGRPPAPALRPSEVAKTISTKSGKAPLRTHY